MKLIVASIALAIASSAVAAPSQEALMAGKWRSTDDAKAMVEIRADGTWIDSYVGEPSATATSHWLLFSGAKPPKAAAGETLDATSTYLEVNDQDGGQLFYALDKLDAKTLELLYLDRGNELNYRRVTPAP